MTKRELDEAANKHKTGQTLKEELQERVIAWMRSRPRTVQATASSS